MLQAVRVLLTVPFLLLAVQARAQEGAALYAQRCQACHEGNSGVRAPSREVIALLAPERIVQALETGVMREQGAGLSAVQRRVLAVFLSRTNGTDAAATASMAPGGACAPSTAAFQPGERGDWNGWGASPANDRFQRSAGFIPSEVPKLKLKWAFGFEGDNSAATQPAIVGRRVFVGSGSGRVYSLDLKTGCTYWMYRAESRVRGAVVIGAVRGGHAAFFGDGTANVYGVDAATGQLKWKRRVDDHRAARISGSPVFHNGRIYVPVSSSEEGNSAVATYECCTFRGSVVALDAESGAVIWKTYTISTPPTAQAKNAKGTQLYGPSGAAVWHAPTIDASTGSLYIATGDAYTQPVAGTTDAIMALDLATGAVKWSQQMTGNDAWNMSCGSNDPSNCPEGHGPDSDFGQPPILVSLPGGKRALIAAQKSGKVYAVDPDARGRLLWTLQLANGGVLGGFEWGSASDGQNFYAPASDLTFKVPALWGRGGLDPTKGGGLFAIRVADGKLAWSKPAPPCEAPCSSAQSAPASAMNGVVFSGSIDGNLRAYWVRDGSVMWSFNTAQPFETVNGIKASGGSIDVGGPAISHGMVLTTSGYGQWGGKPGNVLLAFGVD